jgi:hypothetical protein
MSDKMRKTDEWTATKFCENCFKDTEHVVSEYNNMVTEAFGSPLYKDKCTCCGSVTHDL